MADFRARTGGRVVECTGLENPCTIHTKTAESPDFRGKWHAHIANFAHPMPFRDGTKPGTYRSR